jgi:Zn finger protein HypA/HybF involved in hydrogenase expression
MHEVSIAESVLSIARTNLPSGSVLRSVNVRAGRLRAIDPDAMALAWSAVTADQRVGVGSDLRLTLSDWKLRCPTCGDTFTAQEVSPCRCGSEAFPVGTSELLVESIDVD